MATANTSEPMIIGLGGNGSPDRFKQVVRQVWFLVEPVCRAEGIELVHVELQREPHGRVLRLYIDKPGGVGLNDCRMVSRRIGDLVDVGCEFEGAYHLEVTSPGVNRPIGKYTDFERYMGRRIKLRTQTRTCGRVRFTGDICGFNMEKTPSLQIKTDDKTYQIPMSDIAAARLVGPHGEKT